MNCRSITESGLYLIQYIEFQMMIYLHVIYNIIKVYFEWIMNNIRPMPTLFSFYSHNKRFKTKRLDIASFVALLTCTSQRYVRDWTPWWFPPQRTPLYALQCHKPGPRVCSTDRQMWWKGIPLPRECIWKKAIHSWYSFLSENGTMYYMTIYVVIAITAPFQCKNREQHTPSIW